MNTIESLNVRTSAARGRLTELERRLEKASVPGPVVKPALKELSAAIEELEVANEQLSEYANDLGAARHDLIGLEARHEEFIHLVPVACIWTDEQGSIAQANEATAAMLNVAARRLAGKPLSLFLSDRATFFEALSSLRPGQNHKVSLAVLVRPRERRPRSMQLTGYRLRADDRLCWILRHPETEVPEFAPIEEPELN